MGHALTSKLLASLIGSFNFGISNSLQSEAPFAEGPIPSYPYYMIHKHPSSLFFFSILILTHEMQEQSLFFSAVKP